MNNYRDAYNLWVNSEIINKETKDELKNIEDEKEIEDRFYKNLMFGTGGLRGVIGAGTNRMNIYTISKATEGLSRYLLDEFKQNVSVCIGYDSRNKSKQFAETAATVLCAHNIKVNLFESLRPTPMLSFSVRHLKANAGIVITASHNPKQYNGYKVYGRDGGQITDKKANKIIKYINKILNFEDVKTINLEEAKQKKLLKIIDQSLDNSYYEKVKSLSIRKDLVKDNAKNLKVIYTPLHGSGNIPIRTVLKQLGYKNLHVVKEQELPDGNFPTVEYPNPEYPEVFSIALKMAQSIKPDIIFGTDPDCDRIGVVVKNKNGEYKVLTGNQTGVLLSHYIVSSLSEQKKLPRNGTIIKTIVTTDMVKDIAKKYGVKVEEVLTGFKYIGEKIKEFNENNNKDNKYIFGFEESYGYLAGEFVRDKDAVIAAMLVCEMALYYKTKGMSLYDALIKLYEEYGYYKEDLVSIEMEGKEGQKRIDEIMQYLRHCMKININKVGIKEKYDYKAGIRKNIVNFNEKTINLPKSNVVKFILEDNSSFTVRPSGTEPKIKIYFSTCCKNSEESKDKLDKLKQNVMKIIKNA